MLADAFKDKIDSLAQRILIALHKLREGGEKGNREARFRRESQLLQIKRSTESRLVQEDGLSISAGAFYQK